MSGRSCFARVALAALFVSGVSIAAFASSHVRIVRLSSVEGQVQMDRGLGSGPERAILNAPIVEGTRLITGSSGLAEVEFENESALRLTDNSEVKFSQLLMNDAGAKINQFEVVKGLVYLETASKGDDVYRVKVGDSSLLVRRDSQMRLGITSDKMQVAVLKGNVELENQAQPVSVHKKQTLTVDLKKPAEYAVVNGTEPVQFDRWNKERDEYSNTYASNEGYAGPTRGYGLQDLNYYGNYSYASGYGYVWQPYGFAGTMANWDPYSNGAWMFYPGVGYTFASGYPWGWLPFHYGSWAYINSMGWAWVPGNSYGGQWYANSFLTTPRITKAPNGWTAAAPPAVMEGSAPRTVLVGASATSTTPTIPGGRIPPNFGSLVPGHATGATAVASSFIKPSAATSGRTAFADTGFAADHHGMGHVFAPRLSRGSEGGPQTAGGYGGGYAGAAQSGTMGVGSGPVSPSRSGGGGGHK